MAIRKDKSSCFKLNYVIGQTADGKDKCKLVTFDHISPDASDDDVLEVASGLASLQAGTVRSYIRTDSASLVKGSETNG